MEKEEIIGVIREHMECCPVLTMAREIRVYEHREDVVVEVRIII